MPNLTWTRERPREPGYYLFRGRPYGHLDMVLIHIMIGRGKRTELWGYHGGDYGTQLAMFRGRWAGPIPQPEEPRG